MMKAGFLTLVGLVPWAPYALAVPGGLSSIAEKAREIETLCTVVAGIIVGIGAVWCGVKFVKGDPDSWGYVWKFGLGAILIFSAPQVVAWLIGGWSGSDARPSAHGPRQLLDSAYG